jgi:hypothetical protein
VRRDDDDDDDDAHILSYSASASGIISVLLARLAWLAFASVRQRRFFWFYFDPLLTAHLSVPTSLAVFLCSFLRSFASSFLPRSSQTTILLIHHIHININLH